MDEISPTLREVERASRLAAPQRRRLKKLLQESELAGRRVTVPGTRELVAVEMGLGVSDAVAGSLLTQFGYYQTSELDPTLSGAGELSGIPVWVMDEKARPLSASEKAQALSERMTVLADAFVEDLMEDSLLRFGSLDDIAIEASRSFALSLSAAIQSRARIGAKTLLPRCGEVAQLTFRAGAQR